MLHKGLQLCFVVRNTIRSIKGFIKSEEGHNRVRLQESEPFVRHWEKAFAEVHRQFRMKLLSARKCPLRHPRRMRTKPWRISGTAHVSDEEFAVGIPQLQLGFESAIVNITLGKPIANEDNTLAFGRRSHHLRTCRGSGARHGHERVGSISRSRVHLSWNWRIGSHARHAQKRKGRES